MKLLIAVAICTALLAAVDGRTFNVSCIKMDVDGTVTVTAKNTKTNATEVPVVVDLSTAKVTNVTGNCSTANTVVTMTVAFDNATDCVLTFKSAIKKVTVEQMVTFNPAAVFNSSSMKDSVTLTTPEPLELSSSDKSYECHSTQLITFAPKQKGNYSYGITQNITSLKVQAFGLPNNGSYSPAEECAGDLTTVAPATTVAPTPGPVKPVNPVTFMVNNSKGVACFKLVAGLQFAVEYERDDKTMVVSKPIAILSTANVTGTCTDSKDTMTISEGDYSMVITETKAKQVASTNVKLTVKLDPANFPNAAKPNTNQTFELTTFTQSSNDTFYRCDSQQELGFDGNTTTTLFTNDVRLQGFGLKNGSFSGEGVRCGLDPTPMPTPGDNTYVLQNKDKNVSCIVLTGEISFSNVSYIMKNGSHALAQPIVIPTMNKTTQNVKVTGSCDMEGGNAQQLNITFNTNWILALTFAKGSSKDSSMLGASANEFSVRDISLTYYLVPAFFPSANQSHAKVTVSQTNITTDFMKGSTGGGSYKCDAVQTETLGEGVEFQTAKLQYKAFNNDNTTTFGSNVSECSADDESNSIVPIAVGAALAGLVAIVLIAYLIGRRRSRRQGYESV